MYSRTQKQYCTVQYTLYKTVPYITAESDPAITSSSTPRDVNSLRFPPAPAPAHCQQLSVSCSVYREGSDRVH